MSVPTSHYIRLRQRGDRRGACTEDEIAHGLALAAYIVTRYGPVYAPIFDFLERELAKARSQGDPVGRARRHLAAAAVTVPSRSLT